MPEKIENKRKTLANCKLSEFTKAAMQVRDLVCEYYKLLDIPKLAEKYKDIDAEKKPEVFKNILIDIMREGMMNHPIETVNIIAAEAFLTFEEAEELEPIEALEIFLECAMSRRVIDFFINVEVLAQSGTDSILPALILLKQTISAMNTSESESQSSTTDISEKSNVGDMSESA